MKHRAFAVYLNDHLALITGEVALLQRVRDENEGSALAASVDTFAEAVERQRERVKQLIEAAGGSANSMKQAAAWLGEKLGRLKPNDGATQYTDLARVVELEALLGLAFSRQTLWATLKRIDMHGDLNPDERAASEGQARTQLAAVEEHHRVAVARAFLERPSDG